MDRPGAPRPVWLREHHRAATRPLDPLPRPEAPAAVGSAREHCSVHGSQGSPGPWPGVLVEWRREAGVWVAQVAYVVLEEPPVLVVAWVGSELLRPA